MTYWRPLLLLLLFITGCLFLTTCSQEDERNQLNVYNWFNVISPAILEEFEKEFGIKIVYDVYDSNDVLEAKILSGNSGYDVVFPSCYPYLARQLESKVYAKLDQAKIPNLQLVDPELMGLLDKIPEGKEHAVPYMWGITVVGYRADLIEKILPRAPVQSLKMLYDVEVIKKASKCGVSYLEEPIDVIPLALHYLGYPHDSAKESDIQRATTLLKTLRPYVSQFAASRPVEDLVTGDACLIQNWLGAILEIQEQVKTMKNPPDIRYSIPSEGTSMWLDVIAIPVDAPHKENAYKFINFLLRPENMAKVTNQTFFMNSVPSSEPFIQEKIREKLKLDSATRAKVFQTTIVHKEHIKKLTRALQSVVSGE